MEWLVCKSREGAGDLSTDDLTIGRPYLLITPADDQGMVRVIDDSGEDYLYPEHLFDVPLDPA